MMALKHALLALAIFAVAASGAAPPPRHRAAPPAKPSPPPCRFLPETPIQPPGCITSSAYVASLDRVAATGSPNARFEVKAAYYTSMCQRHEALNMSTPEGKAACRADTENRCYLTPNSGRTCNSAYTNLLLANELLCPGTPNQRDARCYALFKDECVKDPECDWNPVVYYNGAANRDRFTPVAEANVGAPVPWAMCRSKEYTSFVLLNETTVNQTARTYWNNKIAVGDTEDDADWAAKVGTCEYAATSRAARKYQAACIAANNLITSTGNQYIDPSNYNATRKCIEAGCRMMWYDGIRSRARGNNVTDSYVQCNVEPTRYYSLMFPSRFDRPLTDAYLTCGTGRDYDRQLCEGATLPGYPY
ncbi:hypothetical protein HYH02_015503 [Chlamydomonas schloesseri]|uniref:Uncharacterized protein n=1 Tax=Chlamydomonas schloesseri TaxID=2026947 RepID=A0A835VM88_9CHLO|nr:hypothetical protein HYH02_015503 [Chlamydomonas schloesseri]|eukprot:KAG2422127.1 hypothetical protein HYH02_015503 [Chlamydomonas schloesseri]